MQQWLVSGQLPIESDVYELTLLLECPDATSAKVAASADGEMLRTLGFSRAGFPPQCVGQPAFGVQTDSTAYAVLIAWRDFLSLEIDGGPPARIIQRMADEVVNFVRCALHAPGVMK